MISGFLVAHAYFFASDWPRTFLHLRCFCLALYYTGEKEMMWLIFLALKKCIGCTPGHYCTRLQNLYPYEKLRKW